MPGIHSFALRADIGPERRGGPNMMRGIYRMSPEQFQKALDAGAFGERKVELLGGVPFVMSTNPPHIFAALRLIAALQALAPSPRWVVSKEHTLALGSWRPLADGVVLQGPDTAYAARLARARDVALLVEISDTTYARDAGPKLRRYATCRVPVYWIIDLKRRRAEIHTGPFGKGRQAGYAHCDIVPEGGQAPVMLDGHEAGRIAVAALLP